MPLSRGLLNTCDILIKADAANAALVYAALAEFGAPLDELTPEDFIEKGQILPYGASSPDGRYFVGDERRRF